MYLKIRKLSTKQTIIEIYKYHIIDYVKYEIMR